MPAIAPAEMELPFEFVDGLEAAPTAVPVDATLPLVVVASVVAVLDGIAVAAAADSADANVSLPHVSDASTVRAVKVNELKQIESRPIRRDTHH